MSCRNIARVVACLGAAVLLMLGSPAPSLAQPATADELAVKAAIIFNVSHFVEWPAGKPADPKGPFLIGIWGPELLVSEVEKAVHGRAVGDHPVVVRNLATSPSPEQCQIVFFSRSRRKQFIENAAYLAKSGVLTIGESNGFANEGGVIGLVVRENRVQLEVNLKAAQRAHLGISSRLLRLSTLVEEGG